MRYKLETTTHRLDATVEKKESVLQTRAEALYAIAQELRHDDFVNSFVFNVTVDRAGI
jgi:hypothetical protein